MVRYSVAKFCIKLHEIITYIFHILAYKGFVMRPKTIFPRWTHAHHWPNVAAMCDLVRQYMIYTDIFGNFRIKYKKLVFAKSDAMETMNNYSNAIQKNTIAHTIKPRTTRARKHQHLHLAIVQSRQAVICIEWYVKASIIQWLTIHRLRLMFPSTSVTSLLLSMIAWVRHNIRKSKDTNES